VRQAAIPGLLALCAILAAGLGSCSVGSGNGTISGVLNVPDCWSGPYNLLPDFFAAVPYLSTLELRIQKGGDYETFSDGVAILIDDTSTIIPAEYGKALTVSLPVGVTPVGVPLAANPNPSIVHMSLYLQATCQIQDVALYALDSVTLNPSGDCYDADGSAPIVVCPGSESGLVDGGAAPSEDAGAAPSEDAGAAESGPQPIGHSTVTFTSLFDGNENAVSASERLNTGKFSVYLADPREVCPGGVGPPPPCRGYLTGKFNFEFQQGRPGEPFP
jgi:hypothetical protein